VIFGSVNPGSLAITIVYAGLLLWGFSVGARQIYQGFRAPKELLNPLFANRQAITMFTLHIVIVTADLAIIGPLAIAHKSTLWYWGGRIALLISSMPLASFLNRNPESFGKLIGRWVVFRNFFEYTVHVVVAAMALNWFHYYVLLWWLVAYRYLDVGPRRLLQTLYNTPEKKAARPWAPILNWAVIASLYVLSGIAVYNRQILFAHVPGPHVIAHVPKHWETGLVWGGDLALVLVTWTMTRKYAQSLIVQAAQSHEVPNVPQAGPIASH
jgi:hypothetical protein